MTAAVNDPGSISINYLKIIAIVYLTGMGIVLSRLIYQAIFLHAISRLSKKTEYDGYTIVRMSNDMIPFSYFKRIFIPSRVLDEGSFDYIIDHEKFHLSQGHFIDLFIVEAVALLQWFNPVIWLYEKSIKEMHEYLADEAVLNSGRSKGNYQAHLVNQALGGPVFILTSQFNQSLIKKRIMMMKKMKTSQLTKFKALLILPLIAGLLLAFANQQRSVSETQNPEITITGNISDGSSGDALQGGVIMIKGTTEGTITDKNGNYSIIVSDNSHVLVFSHTGYRTQEIPIESNTMINVQLEKEILELDFSEAGRSDAGVEQKVNKGQSADPAGANEKMYVVTEEMPSYPGGTEALVQFLKANLRYPADARSKGIQGKVMVNFVVNAGGNITDARVMRGVSNDLDTEALRLVNSMKGWKPASHNGVPLSMGVTMPIEFKLK